MICRRRSGWRNAARILPGSHRISLACLASCASSSSAGATARRLAARICGKVRQRLRRSIPGRGSRASARGTGASHGSATMRPWRLRTRRAGRRALWTETGTLPRGVAARLFLARLHRAVMRSAAVIWCGWTSGASGSGRGGRGERRNTLRFSALPWIFGGGWVFGPSGAWGGWRFWGGGDHLGGTAALDLEHREAATDLAVGREGEPAVDTGETVGLRQRADRVAALAQHARDCRGVEGKVGERRRRGVVFGGVGLLQRAARGGVGGGVPGADDLAASAG